MFRPLAGSEMYDYVLYCKLSTYACTILVGSAFFTVIFRTRYTVFLVGSVNKYAVSGGQRPSVHGYCIGHLVIVQCDGIRSYWYGLEWPDGLCNNTVRDVFAMCAYSIICTYRLSTKMCYPRWNWRVHWTVLLRLHL